MDSKTTRRLIFQVAVGEVPSFYGPCTASVEAYAARVGADYMKLTEPVLRIVPKKSQRSENALRLGYLPIFEKEAAFAYLGKYEQIAIIDADVYARASAPDIFRQAACVHFAGVLEQDLPLQDKYLRKVRNYAQDQYGDPETPYYNMGVTVWHETVLRWMNGETPKQFIERPRFEAFVNGEGKYRWSTDQTLLNTWVKQTGMIRQNLDWRWNCMYDYVLPTALRLNPHFVHFALASKMPRGGEEIPEIIERMA